MTMGFEAMYQGSAPPWDIGRPQPAIVRLEEAGLLAGPIVDVGCGTGENAIYLASRGHETVGVDIAPTAIGVARAKARERGSGASFAEADVLRLGVLGRRFRSAIDVGCFHVFDDADRTRYRDSVASVVDPDGILHLLCFSDREPGTWGPRRVSQAEIRATFDVGWEVESIDGTRFATLLGPEGAAAWHAAIRRR
jgi:SAM-dependent methyltransferase